MPAVRASPGRAHKPLPRARAPRPRPCLRVPQEPRCGPGASHCRPAGNPHAPTRRRGSPRSGALRHCGRRPGTQQRRAYSEDYAEFTGQLNGQDTPGERIVASYSWISAANSSKRQPPGEPASVWLSSSSSSRAAQ